MSEYTITKTAYEMETLNYTIHKRQMGLYLNKLGYTGIGAEVGVDFGEHSENLLNLWSGSLLYSIDWWKAQPKEVYDDPCNANGQAEYDKSYERAKAKLSKFDKRSIIMRLPSHEASQQFVDEYFDFVYIDANHGHKEVLADLYDWWPKVKRGGLLCGDDFHPIWGGVISATNQFATEYKVTLLQGGESSAWQWYIFK